METSESDDVELHWPPKSFRGVFYTSIYGNSHCERGMLTSEYSASKLNGALWRQEELAVSDVQSNKETKKLAKLAPFLIFNNSSAFIEVKSHLLSL